MEKYHLLDCCDLEKHSLHKYFNFDMYAYIALSCAELFYSWITIELRCL